MKAAFLVAHLLFAGGEYMPGDEVPGWEARQQPSMEVCKQRQRYAEMQPPLTMNIAQIFWHCEYREAVGK